MAAVPVPGSQPGTPLPAKVEVLPAAVIFTTTAPLFSETKILPLESEQIPVGGHVNGLEVGLPTKVLTAPDVFVESLPELFPLLLLFLQD